MIQAIEIHEADKWDELVQKFPDHTFLQSWSWGEFQETLGNQTKRFAYTSDDQVIGAASINIEKNRYGKWMYVPYGPLTDWGKDTYKEILSHLKATSKQERCTYLTIDPQVGDTDLNKSLLRSNSFVQGPRHIQARHKWLLDITKDETTLMSDMRKNTRYSINKALKEGVVIKSAKSSEDLEIFQEIIGQTAGRKKFFLHTPEYFKNEYETLSKRDSIMLFWAEYKGKPVSAAIVTYFGKHAGYAWGATVNDLSNKIPAAYPVLWEAIKEAKSRGVSVFDFWGIAPPDSQNHQWAGFTFFKTGFGGYYKRLILPFDFPTSPKYWIIRAIAESRKIWGRLYRLIKT